ITAEDLSRVLTPTHRIKPTSTRCHSAWQPNPAEAPLIDAEILFRQAGPAQYKGYHQAHNAKVVICALFTTLNSLKLQERRKAFSPIRKVRAISQKLYSHSQPPNPHSV